MGIEVDRTEFSDEDRAAFGRRLGENLAALRGLLSTPGFGEPSTRKERNGIQLPKVEGRTTK